jgi:hypothetical protein
LIRGGARDGESRQRRVHRAAVELVTAIDTVFEISRLGEKPRSRFHIPKCVNELIVRVNYVDKLWVDICP